jgi:alpha-N-arabinofuranosidase
LLAVAVSAAATNDVAQPPVNLAIDASRVVGRIDERIYGHFLEHIYHSCNGGLWGELVWNRSFEFRPQTNRTENPAPGPTPVGAIASYWTAFGDGQVGCTTEAPLNSKYCLAIEPAAGESGVRQSPFALQKGETYRGSLWARGQGRLRVRLLDGQTVLAERVLEVASSEWRELAVVLQPTADAANATLQVGVTGGRVWIDQISLMPDSWAAGGGFRPDLLRPISDLRPPVLRWPGGSFASKYRWKSGIGPQHQRVSFPAPMWDDLEVNAFGTDEFLALCRKIKTEPIVVVNIGQPDLSQREAYCREAAEWVEYCNGSTNRPWGRVRAAHGHPEPYRIKYWEIDNEVWKVPASAYVSIVRQFAAAMKQVDPDIVLIACGSGQLGGRWPEGDRAVIDEAAEDVDLLSVHHYENVNNYGAGPRADEAFWARIEARIGRSRNPDLKLFVSEWNLQSTDWRTGLYAGGILNAFERHPIVGMATPALFLRHVSATKWDNAFINFDHRTWFPAPNYVVMKLYRDHYLHERVKVEGDCRGLDVLATRSPAKDRVVLKLVNPTEAPVRVQATFQDGFVPAEATLQVVAPEALDARNTIERPDVVRAVSGPIERDGATVRFSLPRWSVGVVNVTSASAPQPPLVEECPAHTARIGW